MPKGTPKNGINKGWFKKGHHREHTEEEKRKIGLANSKSLKGKKLTQQHKDNISKGVMGKNKGRKNGNWIHGKSSEKYASGWGEMLRESIRQRDNYVCQECNNTSDRRLCVHHIDYNKHNNHPNNLISLCGSCHAKTTIKSMMEYHKNRYQKMLIERFRDYNRESN